MKNKEIYDLRKIDMEIRSIYSLDDSLEIIDYQVDILYYDPNMKILETIDIGLVKDPDEVAYGIVLDWLESIVKINFQAIK